VCMCVCVCVCVYVCACVCVCICVCVCMCVCVCVIYIFIYLFIDNMLHYNVILHVPVLHLVLSYIFLFGICVALKQKRSAHMTVILMKSERILY